MRFKIYAGLDLLVQAGAERSVTTVFIACATTPIAGSPIESIGESMAHSGFADAVLAAASAVGMEGRIAGPSMEVHPDIRHFSRNIGILLRNINLKN